MYVFATPRVCIRPEICRAKTFGYKGVSKGEFSPFLKLIKLNDLPVDFSTVDLSYLKQVREIVRLSDTMCGLQWDI